MELEKTKLLSFITSDKQIPGSQTFLSGQNSLIEEMKHSSQLKNTGLRSTILLRSIEKDIVLTSLKKGIEIVAFQSENQVSIKVIEGSLDFNNQNESVELNPDETLTFRKRDNFTISASEDTIFLMMILKKSVHLPEKETGLFYND